MSEHSQYTLQFPLFDGEAPWRICGEKKCCKPSLFANWSGFHFPKIRCRPKCFQAISLELNQAPRDLPKSGTRPVSKSSIELCLYLWSSQNSTFACQSHSLLCEHQGETRINISFASERCTDLPTRAKTHAERLTYSKYIKWPGDPSFGVKTVCAHNLPFVTLTIKNASMLNGYTYTLQVSIQVWLGDNFRDVLEALFEAHHQVL